MVCSADNCFCKRQLRPPAMSDALPRRDRRSAAVGHLLVYLHRSALKQAARGFLGARGCAGTPSSLSLPSAHTFDNQTGAMHGSAATSLQRRCGVAAVPAPSLQRLAPPPPPRAKAAAGRRTSAAAAAGSCTKGFVRSVSRCRCASGDAASTSAPSRALVTCRRCRQRFDPAANDSGACRFHPEMWSGGVA